MAAVKDPSSNVFPLNCVLVANRVTSAIKPSASDFSVARSEEVLMSLAD